MALERNGLVQRDGRGGFRPGEVFVSYAWRGGAEAGLITVAQPFLDRLGQATGETINLGVASRGMVEQIAQVDSTYLIGGTNWVGLSVPLHCAALGKVLLAYDAAELPRGRLARRTGNTITSREALEADLAAGAAPRLRGDQRGARARPGRGGGAGLPRRRRPWSPRSRCPARPPG